MELPPEGVPGAAEDDGGRMSASGGGSPRWGAEPWGARGGGGEEEVGEEAGLLLPLTLSIWVDSSVLEVFAMGGAGRMTSRIYPLDAGWAWGVEAWARCGVADVAVQAEVHELGSCWVEG